jgi:hypothetical protein
LLDRTGWHTLAPVEIVVIMCWGQSHLDGNFSASGRQQCQGETQRHLPNELEKRTGESLIQGPAREKQKADECAAQVPETLAKPCNLVIKKLKSMVEGKKHRSLDSEAAAAQAAAAAKAQPQADNAAG